MPLYSFEDLKTGERAEHFFHMADAPEIGATVRIEGRRWRRVPEIHAPGASVPSYESIAYSPRDWHPAAKRHTPDGRPVFTSRKEVEEFQARSEGEYVWDR